MIRSKRGLKAVGLCALAFGLIALGTNVVQAEEGAKWTLINQVGELLEIKGALLPSVVIASVVNSEMVLLANTKGGTKIELLCTGAQFLGASLEAGGKVSSGNKTKFTGCVMKLNGSVSVPCEPHTGSEKGTFTSNGLKGLLVLHELAGGAKDTLIRFEPVEGTAFVTVSLGEECSIGASCTITGVSTVKDAENQFGTEKVQHLVEQGPLSNLQFNGNPASVDGAALLQLAGVHQNLKWAGIPG
jgi:hypothetical protein